MPTAVLLHRSQGYFNIILLALLLQSTACYIKQCNNMGDGTTYLRVGTDLYNNVVIQNVFFFTIRL